MVSRRGVGRGMYWQPTNIGSELREGFYAIHSFAMAVGIDDDETGTAELNAGDGYWKLLRWWRLPATV